MGGKKKSLANRLAKMSDDERARYMQHRADIEEEARRRKEQLLTTFMKNKIKKEEAFSKLNLAKINQQWHQILRQGKCKEMKDACEHMKKWVERVLTMKGCTIDNLIKELDEAEFQYSYNLRAHLSQIDVMIQFHQNYLEQLHRTYESDRDLLLEVTMDETEHYLQKVEKDLENMKIFLYAQEVVGRSKIKENHDHYLKKNSEYSKYCRNELEKLRRNKEETCGAIWNDISKVISGYVERTDRRRAQLAELSRLDAESAVEIHFNQERIDCQEAEIENLKNDYTSLTTTRQATIKNLQEVLNFVNKNILKIRKKLQQDLNIDEKRLRLLTDTSNQAMNSMRALIEKGEQILLLASRCRKYETPKDEIKKWAPGFDDVGSSASSENPDVADRAIVCKNGIFLTKKDVLSKEERSSDVLHRETDVENIEDTRKYKTFMRQKYRLKTGKKIVFGQKMKEQLELVSTSPTNKNRKNATSGSNCTSNVKIGILDEEIESLLQMENFWSVYNNVKLDCIKLTEEKGILMKENAKLKEAIKDVLETAILEQNGLVHQHVYRRSRIAVSAPAKMKI